MKIKIAILLIIIINQLSTYAQEYVTDVDGDQYSIISIGNQKWTQQNLQTIHLNDGSEIIYAQDKYVWEQMKVPAYCKVIIANDTLNNFGYLYNWIAVNTGKICPKGWHVPLDSEWTFMVTSIGGELAGGDLKLEDTIVWKSPNCNATNSTKFSALPAGYRNRDGKFYNQYTHAFFWTSSPSINNTAWYRSVGYKDAIIGSTPQSKYNGLSVRCIKDK